MEKSKNKNFIGKQHLEYLRRWFDRQQKTQYIKDIILRKYKANKKKCVCNHLGECPYCLLNARLERFEKDSKNNVYGKWGMKMLEKNGKK